MHVAALVVAPLLFAAGSLAQNTSTTDDGCMRLVGSVACPGFQYAYLSPGNLSNAFPFFASVSDVNSFDAAALKYFSDPYQFRTTKFTDQLGCNNASSAVIRYQRTVLCSMWVNQQWSVNCLSRYNGTSAATSPKMVCQSTCLDYAASERALVNSSIYCPGADTTNGGREAQLVKDYTDCTDWTTLTTNSTDTCVSGDSNEPNCGFGSATSLLCTHCSGNNPDDCCYDSPIDWSVCGFYLPVRTSGSSSSARATASSADGTSQNGSSSKGGLSGGQIAGIVVGSVLGGLFMIGKLALLFWWCRRRQARKDSNKNKLSQQPNNSEKGLIGSSGSPNGTNGSGSSPTMGGDTLYGSAHGAKSAESGLMGGFAGAGAGMGIGAAAAGVAGGAGGGVPERAGVVLPRVRDENQNGEKYIETGAEVRVLWPYVATLPDELDLRPGMKIKVLRLYDDAWGTGQVASGGEPGEQGKQGAFPIVCVSAGSSIGSASSAETHGSY